jgi:hypothetical protein
MAKAGTKANSEGTKAQRHEGTKEDTADQTEGKTPPEKVLGEEPDVCPECPPGKRRLRSRFRSYRFAGVQFFAHVAVVDNDKFQQAVKSPFFGQGKDFWEDTAA